MPATEMAAGATTVDALEARTVKAFVTTRTVTVALLADPRTARSCQVTAVRGASSETV